LNAHENPPILPGLPLKLAPGLPRPFSNNHLLFSPNVALLPFVGVAIPPPTASNSLTLSGEPLADPDVYDNFLLSLADGLPNGDPPRRLESSPLPRPLRGE
jgi:hypothetical protein